MHGTSMHDRCVAVAAHALLSVDMLPHGLTQNPSWCLTHLRPASSYLKPGLLPGWQYRQGLRFKQVTCMSRPSRSMALQAACIAGP